MSRTLRTIALSIVLAVVLGVTGFVHGVWTGRFLPTIDTASEARAERIPLEIGDWKCAPTNDEPDDENLGGATRVLRRLYVNQKNGASVSVSITSGAPGPMVIKHLPTECYVSSGYELKNPPQHFQCVLPQKASDAAEKVSEGANKIPDEFLVAVFRKEQGAVPVSLRVYWSFSADGNWQIPEKPRLKFAGERTLYKLYIVRTLTENEPYDGSPVHEFIPQFTKAMRETFFDSRK